MTTTTEIPSYHPGMSFDVTRATAILVGGTWTDIVPGSVSVEIVKVWGGTFRVLYFADATTGEGAFAFTDAIAGYRGALA
jgi:hypothetical protein